MGLLIDGALTASNPFHLTVVFVAGYLSLSFGIADFVLYIWVDDVFVRRNNSHGMPAISLSKDRSAKFVMSKSG